MGGEWNKLQNNTDMACSSLLLIRQNKIKTYVHECEHMDINGCLSLGYRAKAAGDIPTAKKAYQLAFNDLS